ncbi:MAG: hypothetical protein WCJ02_09505 [bacterium]
MMGNTGLWRATLCRGRTRQSASLQIAGHFLSQYSSIPTFHYSFSSYYLVCSRMAGGGLAYNFNFLPTKHTKSTKKWYWSVGLHPDRGTGVTVPSKISS